jgi:hypothetical protein
MKKILSVCICMLLIITILPVSAKSNQKTSLSNDTGIGTKWSYKSLKAISSPDGTSYRCIMFCENHEQTLDWISLINESGFQKAWQKKFLELTIFLLIPGTKIFFGLEAFRNWYVGLFIKQWHKDEYSNFLSTYDTENGSGMITYLWLSKTTDKPIDFKAQPDNTWVDNSWILDNGAYIPNPEIWEDAFFWYFDFPPG